MTSFRAGSATGVYTLDISDAVAKANQLKAIFAGIQRASTQAGRGGSATSINAQTRALTQLRNSEIAAARAAGDHAKALGIIQSELGRTAQGTVRYNQLLAQQSRAQAALARQTATGLGTRGGLPILPRELTQFGPEALDQIKSGLLGIVGPAALVTAGFTAVGRAIDLSEESFRLTTALDQTTNAINVQLRGIRSTAEIYQSAAQFADKYKFTQLETNEALRSSVGILRSSTSSAEDLLGVLARLQVASPEQGLQGAALAVKELQGGDIQSLVERFEISRAAANKMKGEIQGGADAVQVLAKYLNDSGITMETLANRTVGATGKMNELKVETESFLRALGGQTGGPGLQLLEARINLTRGATRLLSGDFDQFGRSVTENIAQGQTGLLSFLNILQPFAQQVQARLGAADEAVGRLRVQTELGAGAFNAAANAAQYYAGRVAAAGNAASIAAVQVASLAAATGAQGVANLRIDRDNAANLTGGIAGGLGGGAGGLFSQVDTNQRNLQASRDALALQRARTSAERLAILNRQLARQATEEGRNRILAQIEAEKQGGAARVGTAKNTALQLQNLEQNSGLQLERIQRENLERLRDQQEDFDVGRTRSREDYERKRISLLARGQRAEAARLAQEFAIDQQRDLEDFNRQRRRTLRNNAEGLGDVEARTDLRTSQIQQRAALRGGGASTSSPSGVPASGGTTAGGRIIQVSLPNVLVMPDGQTIANVTWPYLEVKIDDELSLALGNMDIGQGQSASVSGARP